MQADAERDQCDRQDDRAQGYRAADAWLAAAHRKE